jgi:hypothetical protein
MAMCRTQQADEGTEKRAMMNQLHIRIKDSIYDYYIVFNKDGAGIIVTLLDCEGEKIVWNRLDEGEAYDLWEFLS